MAVSESIPIEARVMQVVMRHVESLKHHIDGGELHGIVSRALRRYSRDGKFDPTALTDLHTQLDIYARDPIALPNMRVRARLLQQHIASLLPDEADATPAHAPLLMIESIEAAPPPDEPALEGVLEPPAQTPEQNSAGAEKYQALLRSEKDAWQAIYGTVKDYHKLKQAWMKSLDELARQRDALEQKLVETTTSLTKLEVEREGLQVEVEKLRDSASRRPRAAVLRLALRPSHKPGTLVRREGLLHFLDAEIKRVRRAARPLALGLIAIEGLDALRETQDEKAMEAVLNCYTQEILANFRAYDVVALCRDGVFAVLFPDTGKEGAGRALEKAAKRAAETHLTVGDRIIALPRFTHALVLHTAGEDSTAFIKRAEGALKAARTPVSVVA